MAQRLRALELEPRFNSQHPHDSLQPSVTSYRGLVRLLASMGAACTRHMAAHADNTSAHTVIIKHL